MAENGVHGLLVLDKPGGMTSRAALNRAQAWFPRGTKIGHTGTLDPLATGVLVICLGQATRLAEYVQAMRKTYRSTFLLGSRSETDDADGTVTANPAAKPVGVGQIRDALASFVGELEQVPPAYSAAKVQGERAYDRAREGEPVDLKPRTITVYRIDLLAYDWPRLNVEVECSKGTYIRSIARDLGEKLGCGGLVETLRRTRVGPFRVEDAVTLDATAEQAASRMRPVAEAVAELPRLVVSDDDIRRLRQGQAIRGDGRGTTAIFATNGELIGIGECDGAGQFVRPSKILS